VDGVLAASARGYADVLMELLEGRAESYEIATMFYSADVGEETAAKTAARVQEAYPDLEVEMHAGGPDLYPYLMVLE